MPPAEINNQVDITFSMDVLIIYAPGLVLLVGWLCRTSFGRKAFDDAETRFNSIPFYAPFALLILWVFIGVLFAQTGKMVFSDLSGWREVFVENFMLCLGTIATIVPVLYLARIYFFHKLKGFGLDFRRIHKDIAGGALNLFTAWPVIMLTLMVTILVCQLIFGSDYQVKQHEELEMITSYSQWQLRVLIFITAGFVVPIFEEMLFRGMFQTTILSYISVLPIFGRVEDKNLQTWLAIFITSILFVTAHQNPSHWPALFVLSAVLGYSYEKSNSILRPIFIHMLFNSFVISTALYFA